MVPGQWYLQCTARGCRPPSTLSTLSMLSTHLGERVAFGQDTFDHFRPPLLRSTECSHESTGEYRRAPLGTLRSNVFPPLVCSIEHATCSMRHATCNIRCGMVHSSRQRAACDMQSYTPSTLVRHGWRCSRASTCCPTRLESRRARSGFGSGGPSAETPY
jgi:hypothetical protein